MADVLEVFVETGKIIERDYTAAEAKERDASQAQAAKDTADKLAIIEAKAAAKQSAQAKLAALGLTDDEVAAILGN